MNKNILLAAMMIGTSYGMRVYALDLADDTSNETDIARCEYLGRYAAIAVEMADTAYTFNFVYPENYQTEVFDYFGDWFGDYIYEDDDNKMPSNEDCLERLKNLVASAFQHQFKTQESRDKLERALQTVIDDHTD